MQQTPEDDMDIRTIPPKEYARMLRNQGVPEAQIGERMAHDMLVALSAQFGEQGIPTGFDGLAADVLALLTDTAKSETKQ
jgi:hypothetical protein